MNKYLKMYPGTPTPPDVLKKLAEHINKIDGIIVAVRFKDGTCESYMSGTIEGVSYMNTILTESIHAQVSNMKKFDYQVKPTIDDDDESA